MAGKFDNSRDSFLHWACTQEWSNQSDGNVEAPTGYFWIIQFSFEEVAGDNTEFNGLLIEWLEESGEEVKDVWELRRSLMGNFLLVEDSQGFVNVTEYPTGAEMMGAYHSLETIYSEWEYTEDYED